MKTLSFVIIASCSLLAQTAKPIHAKSLARPTAGAQKCWKDVQMYATLRFSALPSQALADAALRSNECADILKSDPSKSAIATRITELALTTASLTVVKQNLSDASTALTATDEAKKKSESMINFLVSEYNKLNSEYQAYIADTSKFAGLVKTYLDSEIQAQSLQQTHPNEQRGARGYFANVLQSMGDAAKAETMRPTIHCASNIWGGTTYTDCR